MSCVDALSRTELVETPQLLLVHVNGERGTDRAACDVDVM